MQHDPGSLAEQKLTPKQIAFCQEYVIDFNATQAAIRAGYSPRTANEQAARALANAAIRAEVQWLITERRKRVEVDADFVIRHLVDNVQRSMQAVPVLDAEGKPIGQYRYNGAVANKALELLGRHLGMFVDREVTLRPASSAAEVLAQLIDRVERTSNVIDECYIEQVALGGSN